MLRDWLASRTPSPPPRLAARLAAAVPASASSDSNDTSQSLIAAAAAILHETLDQPGNERNGTAALDLLAADALITYAVEAAAEDCEKLAALTDEMILRLAAVTGADRSEST
ncbi:MAG: hypothetical protein M3O61_04135 [Gemmatimonadota bacterium]|nr:hypothetical protein [Gemmatimonadota bacterium]